MHSWYFYSLIALLLMGCQRFFYKVTAEKRCNSALTSALFMGTVTLLSTLSYIGSDAPASNFKILLLLALINSVAFAGATILHMEALRHLPAAIIFPLNRLNLILVILASVVYFGERLNGWQWLGILIGFIVVFILGSDTTKSVKDSRFDYARSGYLYLGGTILCGAIASLSCKFAALHTGKTDFMALSYLLATGFSLAINWKWKKHGEPSNIKASIMIGLAMGVLNFFGFYAFLTALEQGPLSSIATIVGMHFVIAILLSTLIYREKLTPKRLGGIGLTLVAVWLLKQ
jgi:drug/metabolite transporter (DMT)-like permease